MDSLAVSAIGLAAGGWQNVKLVGIYPSQYTDVTPIETPWKLGLFSFCSPYCTENKYLSDAGTKIICPGISIPLFIYGGGMTYRTIQFKLDKIVWPGMSAEYGTTILFTWV